MNRTGRYRVYLFYGGILKLDRAHCNVSQVLKGFLTGFVWEARLQRERS